MTAQPQTNFPPSDVDPLRERLDESYGGFTDRTQSLVDAAKRVPTELDDETLRKATDFVAKQLKTHRKALDSARITEKEPFLTGQRTVDAFFKAMLDQMDKAIHSVERTISGYLRVKAGEERKRREEEARRAAEEATKAAAAMQAEEDLEAALLAELEAKRAALNAQAKPADLARTHGAHGGMATLRKQWTFEVEDWKAVDLEPLRQHFAITSFEQAIRSYVRAGGRELRGVRIFEDHKALVR